MYLCTSARSTSCTWTGHPATCLFPKWAVPLLQSGPGGPVDRKEFCRSRHCSRRETRYCGGKKRCIASDPAVHLVSYVLENSLRKNPCMPGLPQSTSRGFPIASPNNPCSLKSCHRNDMRDIWTQQFNLDNSSGSLY